jgi:ubiquinone/menaquinone biosynthesis C-methylase UbiE
MFDEGYTNITNVDISMVAVKAMQEKYREKVGMTFAQMDCRSMDSAEGSFQIVLDKGTLDSILCGEASTHNVQKALAEISRVLDPKGTYVCVSHGQPSYRLSYLQRPEFGWEVKVHTVLKPMMGMTNQTSSPDEKDNVHYVYICTKGSGADA